MERRLEELKTFAQKVHLTMYNKYFDDIDGEDGLDFVNKIIDFANLFKDELENEADWIYVRQNNFLLGTAQEGMRSLNVSEDIQRLVVSEHRPLVISHDGIVVSEWDVVTPNAIGDPRDRNTNDRVTFLGQSVIFSRPISEHEANGEVRADIMNPIPPLSLRNIEMIRLVQPLQLLVLGVAKNSTLADTVQVDISPSLTQKYADLLEKAIDRNNAMSVAYDISGEDFGYVRGIM